MKPTYEIIETPMGNTVINATFPNGRVLSIPSDPANSDYQRYLAWLENPEAEQSTPNLAD
jgi:hypothetical protein